MATRYAVIGVEGPHDQAFVGKVLMGLGFREFGGKASELDPFWEKFKPAYPKNGKLYDRLDMPSILSTDDLSVALYAAGGASLKTIYLGEFEAGDKAHWAPFDEQKALVATVASVLQPGATNTVTIKRDGWIGAATATQVQPFVDFMKRLLNLP